MSKENMLYRYSIGPFDLSSVMEFPELSPLTENRKADRAEITVRLGDVPESLTDAVVKRPFYQTAPDDFLINVPSVARYRAQQGATVTIRPYPGSLPDDWRPFLLGPVLGALCQQRGYLILHASALVVDNGQAVAFCGVSRTGKSTMAAWLHLAGFSVLTDDLCIIDTSSFPSPQVYPCYPTIRLWADTLNHLGKDLTDFCQVRGKLEKYLVPINGSFHKSAAPLSAIYQLKETVDSKECMIERLKGRAAVNKLVNMTHRRHFIRGLGLEIKHFQQCAIVAQKAKILQLNRPWGMEYRGLVIKSLNRHWQEEGLCE